jgi:hypothetical protein
MLCVSVCISNIFYIKEKGGRGSLFVFNFDRNSIFVGIKIILLYNKEESKRKKSFVNQ